MQVNNKFGVGHSIEDVNITMNEHVLVRIEALKLVREWSTGLIVIQSSAIAIVGALLNETPAGWYLFLVAALLVSLVISIWFGAVSVVGTIPYITQNLPENPASDIYSQRGGIGKLTLGQQCMLQGYLFVFSLALFSLTLVMRPHSEPKPTMLKQPVDIRIMGGSLTYA
ncbi:MAG: hypothetical protein ABIK07_21040, partial [Planctomycetota bacterium]